MNILKKTSRVIFSLTLLCLVISGCSSETTDDIIQEPLPEIGPGTLSIEFTTQKTDGQFSPRHLLAVWVTTENNNFIKTLSINAQNQEFINFLEEWNSSSDGNKTDAITGATLQSHQKQILEWNCTDINGDTIPDGIYKVWIEMTEENAKGPNYSFTFTKGAVKDSARLPDQTYFKEIYKVYKH